MGRERMGSQPGNGNRNVKVTARVEGSRYFVRSTQYREVANTVFRSYDTVIGIL